MIVKSLLRRILPVAMLLAAGSLSLSAQFRYGVSIGGNIPVERQPDVEGGVGVHTGGGFSGGLTFEYQAEKCGWAVDASLLYTRASARIHAGLVPNTYRYRLGNDFLQIPVHAKYKFWLPSTKKLVGPFVYTGPSVMFRLDKDQKGFSESYPVRSTWDFGVGIDVINFLQVSAGYRLSLSSALKDSRVNYDGVDIRVAFLFDF